MTKAQRIEQAKTLQSRSFDILERDLETSVTEAGKQVAYADFDARQVAINALFAEAEDAE